MALSDDYFQYDQFLYLQSMAVFRWFFKSRFSIKNYLILYGLWSSNFMVKKIIEKLEISCLFSFEATVSYVELSLTKVVMYFKVEVLEKLRKLFKE